MAPQHYVTRRSQLPAGSHAMFSAGHGYYSGPNPAIQPPPKPLKPVAPKRKSQSVADVANQQVNQQLAPVLGAQDTANQRQNQAIQSFALALLGKLQPIAGQVGGEYDKAIGQTSALSSATAQALRSANPNQQDQQMLAAIGAPQEQRAQIENQNANVFGGGAAALQFTQGEVPGTQLATNKAASVSQAAQLPGIAALKGQQDLASALGTQAQTRQETLAQRPGMVQAATDKIKGNISAKQAAAFDEYKFQTARADAYRSAGMKAEASAAQHQADLAYKYSSLDSQNKRSDASIQARKDIASAQINAANGRAIMAAQAKAKAKGPNGLTAGERATLRKGAAKQMDLYYYGKNPKMHYVSVTNQDGSKTQKAKPVPGSGVSGINYGQAIKRIMSQYSMTKAEATAMANDYYAPGEYGRPAKPVKPKPDTGFRSVKIP